jgi:hypothetical protein
LKVARYLFGLPFDPEDGGSMFLRNISEIYTGLHAVTSQKIVRFIVTVEITSDPEYETVILPAIWYGYESCERREAFTGDQSYQYGVGVQCSRDSLCLLHQGLLRMGISDEFLRTGDVWVP